MTFKPNESAANTKQKNKVEEKKSGIKKTSTLLHCDDDVKKKVIDTSRKVCHINNITEKEMEENSNCSRSSIGRYWRSFWSGYKTTPNWTTIFNLLFCISNRVNTMKGIDQCILAVITLMMGESAVVTSTTDEKVTNIRIELKKDKKQFERKKKAEHGGEQKCGKKKK